MEVLVADTMPALPASRGISTPIATSGRSVRESCAPSARLRERNLREFAGQNALGVPQVDLLLQLAEPKARALAAELAQAQLLLRCC